MTPPRRDTDAAPKNRSDAGALGRGLAIIDVLVDAGRPLTLHEIAEAAKLTDSTAHRILQALSDMGRVQRDAGGKRYHAAARTFTPLTIYHPLQMLRRDTMEPLRQLRVGMELTASLIVFVGMERLVLDLAGGAGILAPYYGTCLTNPLHVAVSGKLLLLKMTPARRHELLGDGPYKKLTPHTITDPVALERELEQVERLGYSTNLDENFIGLSAIGAAIPCEAGPPVGCVIMAGASREFTPERIDEWGRALRDLGNLTSFSQGARATRNLFV